MKDLRPARMLKRDGCFVGALVRNKWLVECRIGNKNGSRHLDCAAVIVDWSKVTLVSTGHRTLRGNGMPFPSTPTQNSYRFQGDAMEARGGFVI